MKDDAAHHSSDAGMSLFTLHGRKPFLWVILLVGFWVLVCAVFAVQLTALGLAPWPVAAALALFDWGPWIVFCPIVVYLADRFPVNPGSWRKSLLVHLVASVIVVALMEGTVTSLSLRKDLLFQHSDRPRSGQLPPEPRGGSPKHQLSAPRFFWFRVFDRARFAVPVYWMLVAVAHAMAQQRRSLEREKQALRAETLLAEARLQALQAQLKPHFLFNTLNTIAELVYENPAAAEDTIVSLGGLLRDVLTAQQRREIRLSDEVAFIERYCAIQRARFGDRLKLSCEIEPTASMALVPALLLQPLVENAIIHGVTPEQGGGIVYVRAKSAGQKLCIEVLDTGKQGCASDFASNGSPLAFREGVGLSNTRGRLEALYGAQQRFEITHAHEGGIAVRIEFPLKYPAP